MSRNGDLHVGILAPDLTYRHGWARYSLQVVHALHQAGVRLTVVAATDSPPLDGVDVYPLLPCVEPMRRGMLPRQLATLPRVSKLLGGCDVIHSLIEPYAPLAARIPGDHALFITGHGSYVRANRMRRPPISWVYTSAFRRATMVCVSNYTARAVREAVPGIEAVVISNGVEAERFSTIKHVGGDVPTVLFVGAIKARKGVVELVRAVGLAREQIPNIRCRIVGSLDAEPGYVARVRETIQELGLNASVELTGRISDDALREAYAHADVFTLPSLNIGWKFEGFGLSLLEASAAGLPVIGSRDCGAEDAVIDGITGLLIAQNNLANELAEAIVRMLTYHVAAEGMGKAGRSHALTQTWERVGTYLIELYRSRMRP